MNYSAPDQRVSDFKALIDRAEHARGADRDLDAALWYVLVEKPRPGDKIDRDMLGRWPAYTASLDAALTLVDSVMKPSLLEVTGGWNPAKPAEWPAWTIRWYQPGVKIDGSSWWAQVGTAPTPALALVKTLLQVVQMQQEAPPHGPGIDDERDPNLPNVRAPA